MSQKISLYIIDDDKDVRDTLTFIFERRGFNVSAFCEPISALQCNFTPFRSCIILDLSMPEMDGLTFQRELRKRNIVIPIIVYSGTASVDSAVSAMAEGAVTVMKKPAKNEALVSTVETAIEEFERKQTQLEQNKQANYSISLLTKREYQVARLITEGFTSSAIAEKLFISPRTVEAHRASAFSKLGLKSIGPLAQLMLRADLYNAQINLILKS